MPSWPVWHFHNNSLHGYALNLSTWNTFSHSIALWDIWSGATKLISNRLFTVQNWLLSRTLMFSLASVMCLKILFLTYRPQSAWNQPFKAHCFCHLCTFGNGSAAPWFRCLLCLPASQGLTEKSPRKRGLLSSVISKNKSHSEIVIYNTEIRM